MKFLRTIAASLTSKKFYEEIVKGKIPSQAAPDESAATSAQAAAHPTTSVPAHAQSHASGHIGHYRSNENIKGGLWFVFKLYIVASLFLTILLSINISTILPKFDDAARNILPPGAEIIIEDGVLSTNTNPIIIPMPKNGAMPVVDSYNFEPNATGTPAEPVNLLVLDITASSTPEDLTARGTVMLVTSEGFIFSGNDARYTVGRFKDIENLNVTIDEEWLVAKIEWAKGFARYIPFIAFFGILIVFYFSSVFASVFYGFIIWLMLKMLRRPASFGTAWTVALYSRTFALLIGLLSFGIPLFAMDSVSIMLQIVFVLLMIMERKRVTIAG